MKKMILLLAVLIAGSLLVLSLLPTIDARRNANLKTNDVSETWGGSEENPAPPIVPTTKRNLKNAEGAPPNEPIPEFIVELLRNPNKPLELSVITNHDPAYVDLLINAYQSTLELTNRRGLITTLAFMEDERVIPVFMNTLTNELAGQTLGERESDIMTLLASRFGVLARQSDSALRFILEEGSRSSFWFRNLNCCSLLN